METSGMVEGTKKKPRSKGRWIIALVLAVVVGFAYFVLQYDPHRVSSVRETDGCDATRFELANKEVVQLIGVGFPPAETRDAARDVVQSLIEGRHIRIVTDELPVSPEKRRLSYVYVKVKGGQQGLDNLLGKMGLEKGKVKVKADGEVFINELLIRLGFAASQPEAPNLKHRDELDSAQTAAKKEGLGMWGEKEKAGSAK